MSTREFSWTLCSPGTKVLLDPVPLFVVLGHSTTVLETEKATVLCEARLHTHKEPNDLEIPAETPLVLVVLDSFQKGAPHCHTTPSDGLSGQWECWGFIPMVQEQSLQTLLGSG